jgi:hypothetical protein
MRKQTRRSALKALGALAAAPAGLTAAPREQGTTPALDANALNAIAEAVLPDEMGAAARRTVVTQFLQWLRGYREGADTDHGYGFTRLRKLGPSPAARYPAQLAALDAVDGQRFHSLSIDRRRAVIVQALTEAKVERLPGRPSGAHIAADLMAFYFTSAAAFDLCYKAPIGRDSCRGLDGSDAEPAERGR